MAKSEIKKLEEILKLMIRQGKNMPEDERWLYLNKIEVHAKRYYELTGKYYKYR